MLDGEQTTAGVPEHNSEIFYFFSSQGHNLTLEKPMSEKWLALKLTDFDVIWSHSVV